MENTLDFNKQEQEVYHFTDLFIENKPLGVAYTAIGTVLLSDSVIENFLNINKIGIERLDISYKKILETPKCSYSVTQQELNELKLFRADNNWFTFKNWLRMNACKNKLEKQSSEYSKNILDYYFSELTESENMNLLNDLKQADSVDRYLFNYWIKHDEIGSDAAIQMVFPLARTRNQEAILILTRISRMGKLSNSVDWTNLKYLVDVTYDVQRQRGAINIKTCLLKLNHILEEYDNNNFLTIYENSFFREILFRYLESNEFKAIFDNNLSKEQLSDYLYTLSSHYKDKGRSTRALRLLELATEIEFSKQAFERLQQYYHENKLKNNEQLIFRTLTLFV